jgi:hypothetical protein
MKLDYKKSVIETGNLGETSTFGMEMNGKAFKMLTGTLYNDKIGSIVRELSCNAVDAHTMAGKKDEPFSIHLPDSFKPYISFTDYGVGMSDSDIREVYTVLFKSTKDNSNDAVGAFGLGSKTPLSYTDNFNVKSIYDGVERDYIVFINDDNIPSITSVGERETDAKNGVTVQVGIENGDFHEVKQAVVEQLKFFDVKPNITNGSVNWVEFENKIVLDDLGYIADGSYYDNSLYFVQGGVGYEIARHHARDWLRGDDNASTVLDDTLNDSQIVINFDDDNASTVLDILNNSQIIINFDIGDFGVTVSREDIEIDDKVKNSFRKRFGDFAKNAKQYALKVLSDAKADMTHVEFINTYYGSSFAKLAGLESGAKFLEFMGSPKYFKVANFNDIVFTHHDLYDSNGKMNFTVERMILKTNRSTKVSASHVYKEFDVSNFDVSTFHLVDSTTRYVMKASYILDTTDDCDSVTTVKSHDGSVLSDSDVKRFKRIIKDIMGSGIECVKLGDVELPKSVKEARKYASAKYRVSKLENYFNDSMRDWQKGNKALDDVNGGVYVPVFNLSPVNNKDAEALSFVKSLVSSSTIKSIPVYAFNEKLSQQVADDSDWISISEYADTLLAKAKLNKLSARYVKSVIVDSVNGHIGYKLKKADVIALRHVDGFDSLTKLLNTKVKTHDRRSKQTWAEKVFECYIKSTYGFRLQCYIERRIRDYVNAEIDKDLGAFRKAFPLLEFTLDLNRFTDDDTLAEFEKHIIQYVNCVK